MRSTEEEANMTVSTERPLRSLPPANAPSFVISHGKKYRDQSFCTLSDERYHVRSVPEMRRMRCLASCYGWLIMDGLYSNQCYLFNPVTLRTIELPPLAHNDYSCAVLTSPPDDNNCVAMFISMKRKRKWCSFCRIGDSKWIGQELRSKDNSSKVISGHIIPLCCKGKIYLFCMGGVAIIDVQDNFAFIEQLPEIEEADSSIPEAMSFNLYFVESCGDIFYVKGINSGFSRTVQTFDVFKLDLSKMVWMKVDSIGDRIFLLGASSTSLSASGLGREGNCIYFTLPKSTRLYKFDMDDKAITITLPCPNKFSYWRGPFWVVPNSKHQVKKEVLNMDETKQSVMHETRDWKELPAELLELILQYLSLRDCIRSRLTCKAWVSLNLPLRLNPLLAQTKSEAQRVPWLVSVSNNNSNECRFYHPIFSNCYFNFLELDGSIVRNANYGWFLLSQGEKSVFFFNPVTKETIKLPDLYPSYSFMNISFSSPPTSSDCLVLGHFEGFDANCMSIYRMGEDAWHVIFITESLYKFENFYCSPVFFDGAFHCLGKNGELGVFNPHEEVDESTWTVVPNTSIPEYNLSPSLLHKSPIRSFIVEGDGEILSVFVGHEGKPVRVFKLDQSKMKWIRVESLGDKVLLLSNAASILVAAGLSGIGDRIYFPRLKGKEMMYYSLRTGKYHCFGSQEPQDDWMNTREHSNCTWIQSYY